MFLCLIKHHVIEIYRGVEAQLRVYLASPLAGYEQSDSYSGRFIPGVKSPGTKGKETGRDPVPLWKLWRREKHMPKPVI